MNQSPNNGAAAIVTTLLGAALAASICMPTWSAPSADAQNERSHSRAESDAADPDGA
ncbi:hypothetical protein GCM10010245_08980 [Streptomyces spectabilis]|uniref:Flagellar motor component MotA n=1 Tax=Streptomyces spectabilis TaxID=68270 RepID=A0A7W8B111_STRST|nr:flagellar motor component MotA [Streptomyces spectabilis]GGV04038.1 hypothetical protein GCM10010245_08980 [Streptomyces spectabilis]